MRMSVLKKIKSYRDVVDYFKELPFYNKHIEKLKIKWLKIISLVTINLLVTDENRSHYLYIKDFNRFMFHKTKKKNKKYFCKSCLQCFNSKNVLTEHKEICLNINGAQSVRLVKGTIEFKYYFKQIPVPFKIYADFECNLKSAESY